MEYGINGVIDACITTCENCNQGLGFDKGCAISRPNCSIVELALREGYNPQTDSLE